jgi:glycosyltransferase involved in cell wall biosynthesis
MDVPVHRLPILRIDGLRAPSFFLTATWHLLRHRGRYDVVHVHGAYWRVLPLLLTAKLMGKKTVVKMSLMGADDPLTIRRRRFGSLLLSALAGVDATVAISEELARSYLEAGLPSERLVRIPNGVDTDLFSPAGSDTHRMLRSELGFPPDAPIVLFVGAVNWRKGVDLLLQAWREVQALSPEAVLALVGPLRGPSGPDIDRPFAQYAREFIARHLPAERVHVLGKRTEIERFYRMADVFVLPSRREGLPNALLEAMACGLPAISTTLPGISQVVDSGHNGLLVSPGEHSALADALLQPLRDPTLAGRLGQAARQTILDRYSMDAVADRYVKLYASLTSEE